MAKATCEMVVVPTCQPQSPRTTRALISSRNLSASFVALTMRNLPARFQRPQTGFTMTPDVPINSG
ncbi:MAG: hypothetical protein R2789_06380 [Microthrixaceae bacterium]